jgi:hypothetical protein
VNSVRYVALVKWKPTATPEQIRAAEARLPEFVPRMKGLVGIHVAPSIEIRPDRQQDWDFAYIADFGNIDDFKVHQSDPAHIEYGMKYVDAARQDSRRVHYLCDASTHKGTSSVVRHALVMQWKAGASDDHVRAAQSAIAQSARNAKGNVGFSAGPSLNADIRPDLNCGITLS